MFIGRSRVKVNSLVINILSSSTLPKIASGSGANAPVRAGNPGDIFISGGFAGGWLRFFPVVQFVSQNRIGPAGPALESCPITANSCLLSALSSSAQMLRSSRISFRKTAGFGSAGCWLRSFAPLWLPVRQTGTGGRARTRRSGRLISEGSYA